MRISTHSRGNEISDSSGIIFFSYSKMRAWGMNSHQFMLPVANLCRAIERKKKIQHVYVALRHEWLKMNVAEPYHHQQKKEKNSKNKTNVVILP